MKAFENSQVLSVNSIREFMNPCDEVDNEHIQLLNENEYDGKGE